MNEIRTAIYTKSQLTSTFKTSIDGRFYWDKAPQSPTYPFVVAHEIVSDYSYTFTEQFENVRVQFNIYSKSTSVSESGTIYNNLKSLFDWSTLSVTDYRCVKIERLFSKSFWDSEKEQYIYVADFNFLLSKNA